ncbi:UPF0481 protein At3g47200-like isoform X1 [Bidens hawaiensis]
MIKDNAVQRLLCHVKKEESYKNGIRPSIYMAPGILRDLSPSSFDPRVVSIGPLHREDKKVQAFERQKARYLSSLIRRTKYPQEEFLKSCVEKVCASMEKIKASYVWTKTYDDAEIVDMMVMDACFILEFLFIEFFTKLKLYENGVLLSMNILFDLLLLENQIPLFVLDDIHRCTILKVNSNVSLQKLIYPIVFDFNFIKAEIELENISINNAHHILSVLHQCYKPPDNIKNGKFTSTIPRSVSDLDSAGVSIKPYNNPTWLLGMEVKLYWSASFFGSWSKPTLRIPTLDVNDYTEYVLRNLIAYELSGTDDAYVSSFAFAMDTLVDTQEDVAKLVDSRVILNALGSNVEVANIINNICREAPFESFFYADQWKILSKYYEGYWPKNIAKMKRIYFSSPWSMIAVVAGIILFVLTVVQTIFTIKST